MATGYEVVTETITASGTGRVLLNAPDGKFVVNSAIELVSTIGPKVCWEGGSRGDALVLDADNRVVGVEFSRQSYDYTAYLICVDG